MTVEEWRPVSGYEKYYEVSNFGKVRSKDRMVRCSRGEKLRLWRGRQLACSTNVGRGYVGANLSVEGVKTVLSVHRLVAQTFIPNPQNKPEVNHKDGDKRNNRVSNLEWVTSSEHAYYGYHYQGRTVPRRSKK